MAFHLLFMCPSKADRAHFAVAERESQTVGDAFDVTPSPVAGFTIVEPMIDQYCCLNEVGNARKRNAVVAEVDGFLFVVEGLAHVDIRTPNNFGRQFFWVYKNRSHPKAPR